MAKRVVVEDARTWLSQHGFQLHNLRFVYPVLDTREPYHPQAFTSPTYAQGMPLYHPAATMFHRDLLDLNKDRQSRQMSDYAVKRASALPSELRQQIFDAYLEETEIWKMTTADMAVRTEIDVLHIHMLSRTNVHDLRDLESRLNDELQTLARPGTCKIHAWRADHTATRQDLWRSFQSCGELGGRGLQIPFCFLR